MGATRPARSREILPGGVWRQTPSARWPASREPESQAEGRPGSLGALHRWGGSEPGHTYTLIGIPLKQAAGAAYAYGEVIKQNGRRGLTLSSS